MGNAPTKNNDEPGSDLVELIRTLSWARFRDTKTYDLLTASPLIVWYWLGVHGQLPLLMRRATEIGAGTISPKDFLQFAAIVGSAAFNVVAIYLLYGPMRRSAPVASPDRGTL